MQLVGVNADLLLILGLLLELNAARDQSEKGVVLADTDVGAGMDVKTLSATIGHVSAANTGTSNILTNLKLQSKQLDVCNLKFERIFFVKIFKIIVLLLLLSLTIQTGYYVLQYKVEITTGAFFICLGITLLVLSDGGIDNKNRK